MLSKSWSVSIWDRACFDPGTLAVASLAGGAIKGISSLVGGSMSANATLAGGNAALLSGQLTQAADNYQAAQLTENAGQAFAAGQRQAIDTADKARLAMGTARADAAGNGTNAGVGSAATIQGAIAKRGSYNAMMDMFNGESAETGMLNQAAGARFSGEASLIGGEEAQSASEIAANATIAGSIGNAFGSVGDMAKTYGSINWPSIFKSA